MSRKSSPGSQVDLSDEQVHWDQEMSYGQYLNLEQLLNCQQPCSTQHDEMLFIVIHQVSELWIKLCLHEAHAAADNIAANQLQPAFKMLSRIARIQDQLVDIWEVLATMTPPDYAEFRQTLGKSSGFQSYQYRELEFLLGNKNAAMVEVHRNHPDHYNRLTQVLNQPSIYDLSLQLLNRSGLPIPEECLKRDWAQPYCPVPEVEASWLQVYQQKEHYWELYELAEKLVDLEFHFQKWRFSHMKTVERIIGRKRGTGGTGGVAYLNKALELRFYPELWAVRTLI